MHLNAQRLSAIYSTTPLRHLSESNSFLVRYRLTCVGLVLLLSCRQSGLDRSVPSLTEECKCIVKATNTLQQPRNVAN